MLPSVLIGGAKLLVDRRPALVVPSDSAAKAPRPPRRLVDKSALEDDMRRLGSVGGGHHSSTWSVLVAEMFVPLLPDGRRTGPPPVDEEARDTLDLLPLLYLQ